MSNQQEDVKGLNLAAAEGHPAAVIDMSFANQALSLVHLLQHGKKLPNQVHKVPLRIDQQIARGKLAAIGLHIDQLTEQQQAYLGSWEEAT
jgi:adenosylhomocysteinase